MGFHYPMCHHCQKAADARPGGLNKTHQYRSRCEMTRIIWNSSWKFDFQFNKFYVTLQIFFWFRLPRSVKCINFVIPNIMSKQKQFNQVWQTINKKYCDSFSELWIKRALKVNWYAPVFHKQCLAIGLLWTVDSGQCSF